ncbi:HNH endonuclease [Enterobacter hormaechei]|nr:HNH endonuclease [Enterobacter hormaechei]MBT2006387.1 HNH endonuclease [Enterobacter hormaechei subsp. xiangfangensis]HCJ7664246.1 HNH endonuclease [Enterobacter hormaechei subsp. xiangfangensis]HDT1430004.1 HNH endonuclease [Enterobacter hormaechei subsp. steigerwaltii]HEM7537467.1 HNH endonuclease [Enterobacter hormaechei]
MVQQAWSFKAIEKDDLKYWGNDGYNDDSSVFYHYNNSVPNHKNVKEGDIVIIRNRENILGISIIEKLESRSTTKTVFKCPHEGCNAKKIRPRETVKPKWRCNNGHEFDERKIVLEPAIEFKASYGSFFKKLKDVSLLQLKSESPRYNIQLSIQEVNIQWAKGLLGTQASSIIPLTAEEADDDSPELLEGDQRKIVDRQIKQRRGQKKFRNMLLNSNPVCAVTGCELVDILEAAHIDAYRNDSHNDISNGLLLRSDIHTLFDLNLFAIHPETNKIHFSKSSKENGYKQFDGKLLNVKHKVSNKAIAKRWLLMNKK